MKNYSPEYMEGKRREVLTINKLIKAIKEETILESIVTSCSDDLTLRLDLGNNIYGVIPFSEVEYNYDNSETKEIAAMSKVGRHVKFRVLNYETQEDGTTIVNCSRRLAQKDCYENYITKLIPGDIIDARIVRVENYGIFCDIGCGFIALLSTNNISVTHIINPKELLEGVNTLKVVVKNIEDNGRIQLSHRELLGTWEEEASRFSKGDIVCGAVLSVEEYGIFVRLSQNLSGLAYIPEKFSVKPGDIVSVRINNISKESMKIKLTIINKLDNATESINFRYYKTEGNIKEWIYSDTKKRIIKTEF